MCLSTGENRLTEGLHKTRTKLRSTLDWAGYGCGGLRIHDSVMLMSEMRWIVHGVSVAERPFRSTALTVELVGRMVKRSFLRARWAPGVVRA